MPHDNADRQSESVADAVTAMKLEHDGDGSPPVTNGSDAVKQEEINELPSNGAHPTITTTMADDDSASAVKQRRSQSQSPVKKEEEEGDADHQEEKVGGDITVRLEPGEPPKLARSSSQKVVPRPPPLYLDLPDSTEEARSTFEVMEMCIYANKFMGYTEHAMECDCAEEWGKHFFFYFPSLLFSCWGFSCVTFFMLAYTIASPSFPYFVPTQNSPFKVFTNSVCFGLIMASRPSECPKHGLWRGFGLYQPCNEDRVRGRLQLWP